MSDVAAPDFFCRILRVSRGGKLTTGVMVLIVLNDWLSNMFVEEIHDMLEERIIEVNFLLPFAEIRHVSLWKKFRNSVVFKLLSVEKRGQFQIAKSDYGSWPKLGVISQCLYSKVFSIKTSARLLWIRRSEIEEAEDVDEDGCTAKSDIVPAEPLEMGNTRCVVFVHKLLSNSSFKRMGGIQFNYLPSSSLFVGKH